jgi:hypothetical protein
VIEIRVANILHSRPFSRTGAEYSLRFLVELLLSDMPHPSCR